MGVLRVILAISVVFTHVGGLWGYRAVGGEIAVECFYLISGFFISLILNEKYTRPGDLTLFYVNRALRIFSLYWLFCLIALVPAVAGVLDGLWDGTTGGESAGPIATLLANAERLGPFGILYIGWGNLGLFFRDLDLFLQVTDHGLAWTADFRKSPLPVYEMMLIPQAWSLGLELAFYVLAPFLVRRSVGVIAAVMAASLALRLAGMRIGLAADPWSYRFFPFELSMFLAGALSYRLYAWLDAERVRRPPGTATRRTDCAIALSLIAAVLLYPLYRTADATFLSASKLFLFAYLGLTLPFLFRLSRASWADRLVGELSYPIYLSHLLPWLALRQLGVLADRPALFTLAVLSASAALSWAAVALVDLPIDRLRQARVAGRQRRDGGLPTDPGRPSYSPDIP